MRTRTTMRQVPAHTHARTLDLVALKQRRKHGDVQVDEANQHSEYDGKERCRTRRRAHAPAPGAKYRIPERQKE